MSTGQHYHDFTTRLLRFRSSTPPALIPKGGATITTSFGDLLEAGYEKVVYYCVNRPKKKAYS